MTSSASISVRPRPEQAGRAISGLAGQPGQPNSVRPQSVRPPIEKSDGAERDGGISPPIPRPLSPTPWGSSGRIGAERGGTTTGTAMDTWTDDDFARFLERQTQLLRWGWPAPDAESLAERLVRRDHSADDRKSCTECAAYRPGRCGHHRRAGLHLPDLGRDLAGMLQRCPGFTAMAPPPRAAPPGHDASELDGQLRRPMTHHRLAHRSGITEDTAT